MSTMIVKYKRVCYYTCIKQLVSGLFECL